MPKIRKYGLFPTTGARRGRGISENKTRDVSGIPTGDNTYCTCALQTRWNDTRIFLRVTGRLLCANPSGGLFAWLLPGPWALMLTCTARLGSALKENTREH